MRSVNCQHVNFLEGHFLRPFQEIAGGADRCADAKASLLVFRCVREFQFFLNVFYGDQALEIEILVHNQQLLDAMALKDFLCFLQSGADGHGDEVVLGHHFADRLVKIALEAQVSIREDAYEALSARDRQPGNLVLVHEIERLPDGNFRSDRYRVHNHAALRPFHLVHFFGLAFDGHVPVNEPDAALSCDRDGETRVRHRVHCCGDDGNIQRDLAAE